MSRSLSLDQLRALETVVGLGSFTGAARRLNLTQSAVSVQIRELEERCGVRLVERLGKKAYATAAGREVIAHARRIADEADAIAAAMRRFREGWIGRVHVASALTALMYLLPPVLKQLRSEHPGIDLVISNSPTATMVEGVLANTIDLAVVTLPVADSRLEVVPLHIDHMAAIVPAATSDIPARITPDYVSQQFLVLEIGGIHALVTNWLLEHASAPQSSMTISTVEAVKTVVGAGLGMAIVPAMAAANVERDIVVRPLSPPLTRTLGLVHHPKKLDDLAFRIVRDALMQLGNIEGAFPARAATRSAAARPGHAID